MKRLNCTIFYNYKTQTSHLRQIFTGFFELQKRGILKISLQQKDWLPHSTTQNLLLVILENKIKILYDSNDGFYWIHGNEDANRNYFKEHLSKVSDFYFKRDYHEKINSWGENSNCKFFPLGLNYELTSKHNKADLISFNIKENFKRKIKSIKLISDLFKITGDSSIYFENFEYVPLSQNKNPKVLFLTRLWTSNFNNIPHLDDATKKEAEENLNKLNSLRVENIVQCKRKFGNNFIGGLSSDSFALKNYPDLIVQKDLSLKQNFMNLVKQSDICIATTGLHNSIGWKFAEYIAASRAVVSEKLHFRIPGNFKAPENFLEFDNVDNLLESVTTLMENKDLREQMMVNNYRYYNNFIRPDSMILNTLLHVINEV